MCSLALAGSTLLPACRSREGDGGRVALPPREAQHDREWDKVLDQFALSPDWIHMSAMYIASHPAPVREAIEHYRRELDRNPVRYLNAQNRRRTDEVLSAAANYLGVGESSDIALTDSTTSGVGLVYNGLRFARGDEVITTDQDYYVTHEALRLAAARSGMRFTKVQVYDESREMDAQALADALLAHIGPRTRALALTWVHSGTGVKLPLALIAERLREVNAARDESEHVLLCVDGVHGFGVENAAMGDIGCDFFMAGCHKWLFGPRGTGVVWGTPKGWARTLPIIPTFLDDETREAWLEGAEVTGRTNGRRMSPGGFKAYEHQWALKDAFDFHESVGRARVEARTHELAEQLKQGLASMPHVRVRTPMARALSSGVVCCEVEGQNPWSVVERLSEKRIVATVTPYARRYVRFSPSMRNTPREVDRVLRAMRAIA